MTLAPRILACSLAAALALSPALGQSAPAPAPANKPETPIYETLHITWLTQQNEANDLQIAMRSMLTHARLYYIPDENALAVNGPPEELAIVKRMLADLDRPRPMYRLTYTLIDLDGTKQIGAQSYALVLATGSKTQLKQGSRIPLPSSAGTEKAADRDISQPQFLDIGLNIEVGLDGSPQALKLRSKIEQSSLAVDKPSPGQDPVIRQTSLEGSVSLTPGKPLVLGTLDIPGSTRREEVQVVAEVLP